MAIVFDNEDKCYKCECGKKIILKSQGAGDSADYCWLEYENGDELEEL